MSTLSRPDSETTTGGGNHANDTLRAMAYKKERVIGSFLLEGEDAYWLKKLADERNFTVEALIKQYAIEGIWRARSYKEL